jgi:trimeric autotransporter adhesin
MKALQMTLAIGWLIASCGVATAKSPKPTLASLQGEVTALQTTVTALQNTVAALQTSVTALQASVTTQAQAVSVQQTQLTSPAARNAFALGNYVTVDTTDATVRGVKAPNIIFSGANIQIVSGSGATLDSTGLGNLVIGYDDDSHDLATIDAARSGSHNLIVGDDNTFTSSGGFVAGYLNGIGSEYASVSGGQGNTANAQYSSVSGGESNTASGEGASVSGGDSNLASGLEASIIGGESNTASGNLTSVSGGQFNTAIGNFSGVAGGENESASLAFHTQVGNFGFNP